MIRVLVIGSILLIGQALPAFAEIATLSCTSNGSANSKIIVVFDTDAHTVSDQNKTTAPGTYPMEVTDRYVKWQSLVNSKTFHAVYDRNSGQLTVAGTFYNVYNCVRVPKPF